MRGWVAVSLVALLLGAQSLGLWHRSVHPQAPALAHQQGHGDDRARAAAAFGHDAGQSEQCRLFDQLTLADSLLVAVAALPVDVLRPVAFVVATATTARRTAAPYEARAPPPGA